MSSTTVHNFDLGHRTGRVVRVPNHKYKRDGTKSYVHALLKCKWTSMASTSRETSMPCLLSPFARYQHGIPASFCPLRIRSETGSSQHAGWQVISRSS